MTGKDNQNPPQTPFASRVPSRRPQSPESLLPLEYPIYEMDTESSRKLDAIAISEYGIPGIVLMENAANALCRHCIDMLTPLTERGVALFCGPGNNGGDGLALARHLRGYEVDLSVHLLCEPGSYTGDALINMQTLQQMGVSISDTPLPQDGSPGLVVDALFGTGLCRPPVGKAAVMINEINSCHEHGTKTLAVDVPSGLDAQTGSPMDPCVRADRTVTFAALKSGFTALDAQSVLGHVVVEDIGVPLELLDRFGIRVCRKTRSSK
jgi:hydroxyethylthiazole kinase-like uncharacterized protein yjeF